MQEEEEAPRRQQMLRKAADSGLATDWAAPGKEELEKEHPAPAPGPLHPWKQRPSPDSQSGVRGHQEQLCRGAPSRVP